MSLNHNNRTVQNSYAVIMIDKVFLYVKPISFKTYIYVSVLRISLQNNLNPNKRLSNNPCRKMCTLLIHVRDSSEVTKKKKLLQGFLGSYGFMAYF